MLCGIDRCVAAATAMGFVASASSGATILFRNGINVLSSDSVISVPSYFGTQDSTLDPTAPDNNLGAWIDFGVGTDAGTGVRQSVVRFDVTAMTGQYQLVNSITLRLFLYTGGFTGAGGTASRFVDVFTINNVDQSWTEGTGLGPFGVVNPGEVCWNSPNQGGAPWSSAALAANDVPVTNGQVNSVVSFPLNLTNPTQVLNSWVTNPQNAGMRVALDQALSPVGSGLLFGARDNPTGVEFVPELLIDYVPIPAPASLSVLALGVGCIRRRR